MTDDRGFVIIGASLAGAKAAQTLREEGFAGRIALIGEEPVRPYERPPLSKEYLQGKAEADVAFVHDPAYYDKHDIDLRLSTQVRGLEPAGREVVLGSGERLGYDAVLLATGATPGAWRSRGPTSRACTTCGPWPMRSDCGPRSPRLAGWW